MHDLRTAWRALRAAPLTTLAIILLTALATSAATAVFSVFSALVLRPLPFPEPERLVWVSETNDKLGITNSAASGPNYRSWLEQSLPLEHLSAIGFASYNLGGGDQPEQLAGGTLTAGVFPALRIEPVLGRAFRADEELPSAAKVAMISESLWRRRFGADPALIGRGVLLDGQQASIIGIAPAALAVLSPGDVWTPHVPDLVREKRLSHLLTAIGRVRDGVTLAEAQGAMTQVAARVGEAYPENRDWSIRLVSFPDFIVPQPLKDAAAMLLAAVLAVLLIAAANIANLQLARALTREGERAVRSALGASRLRIARPVLLECLLLAAAGTGLGMALTAVTLAGALALLPPNLLPVGAIGIDARVLGFSALLALAAGLLFGIAPAWHVARTPPAPVLRAGGRGQVGSGHARLRRGLLVLELALATALLVVAGLLTRSLGQLEQVTLGFDPAHVLTFQLNLPAARDPSDGRPFAFYRALEPALASVPGVESAAISSGVPFGAGNYTRTPVRPTGDSLLAADAALPIDWRVASPSYFRAMGIPLLRGRSFTDADDREAAPAMVVSKSMAEQFWGTLDVLGRGVHRLNDGKAFTVVGVVGDVRLTALNQQAPTMYFASGQRLWPLMDVVVRARGDASSVLATVRQRVAELDPALPLANVRRMDEWVRMSGAQSRLNADLVAAFALLALLTAAVGVYAVLAQGVGQRSGEIGVRMALGARAPAVVAQFVREGLSLAGLGIALGTLAALAAGPVLEGLLYGVSARDPWSFVLAPAALALVAALACIVPARRAARVDPASVLRSG